MPTAFRPQVIQGQIMSDDSVIGRPFWSYIDRLGVATPFQFTLTAGNTGNGKTKWIRIKPYGRSIDICAIRYNQTSPGLPPPPGGTMETGDNSITYFAGDEEVLVQVDGVGKINVQASANLTCSLEGYQ